MKRSQIRKENELKESRYFILTYLNEYDIITEPEFKSYATLIIKMYEKGYYDEYEHILEEIEEEALQKLVEIFIEAYDEGAGTTVNSTGIQILRTIEAICIAKEYPELAESLLDLADRLE